MWVEFDWLILGLSFLTIVLFGQVSALSVIEVDVSVYSNVVFVLLGDVLECTGNT
jgi:hypothetical protein